MLLEKNQVGKREMLADYIARVDAKSTPILSQIPKGPSVTNMLMEWQMDNFEDPDDLAVPDGEDATSFGNASPDRALAQMYAMKVRDTAQVSDLAQNVSNVAGLSKGELAESIMKKLTRVARVLECFLAGDQDAQAGGAGKAYKFRGLGEWIKATAQTTLGVDSNFLTPSASISTTLLSSVTTDTVNTVLQSIYEQTGMDKSYAFVANTNLRKTISTLLTGITTATTNTASVVRTYNSAYTHKLDNVVDVFRGDFGTLNVQTSLFNGYYKANGAFGQSTSAAVQKARGYVVDWSLLELCYRRQPRVKQLEDKGGGPRFLIDAVLGLKCKNPLGLGKFASTS